MYSYFEGDGKSGGGNEDCLQEASLDEDDVDEDDVPVGGKFTVEGNEYDFEGPIPEWGSYVGNIYPWSFIPWDSNTSCNEFYMSKNGKLFKSYQHMNQIMLKLRDEENKALQRKIQV